MLPAYRFILSRTVLISLVAAMLAVPTTGSTDGSEEVLPPVILLWDSGINPYHIDFRVADRFVPPKDYYPDDAVLVQLTLDAATYEEALLADEDVWDSMEFDTLYAFEGTRIVGAYESAPTCVTCPSPILDDSGHGTFVASSFAGASEGACPECRIMVMIGDQGAVEWGLGRTDVDAISNSQGSLAGIGIRLEAEEWIHQWTSSGRSWFTAAGNGVLDGYANHFDSYSGPPATIRVGKGQESQVGGTRTYEIVADHVKTVATHDSMDAYAPASGTSLAAPDAAGHYAQMLWHARQVLGGQGWSPEGLATATSGATLPEQGPLTDGVLTAKELESVMMRTASRTPPPVPGLPNEASYFWEGYGRVDPESVKRAVQVLEGREQMPERPWPDYWHAHDDFVRSIWGGGFARCKADLPAVAPCATDGVTSTQQQPVPQLLPPHMHAHTSTAR